MYTNKQSPSNSSTSSLSLEGSPSPLLLERKDSLAPFAGPSYVVPVGKLHEVFTLIVKTHYQYDLISRCENHYIAALNQFKNKLGTKPDSRYTEQDIDSAIAALRRLVSDLKNAVEQLQSFVIKINANRVYQIARNSPQNLVSISTSTHFWSYLLLAEWIMVSPLFPFLRKAMTIVQLHSNQLSPFYQILLPVLNYLKSEDAQLAGNITTSNGTMIATHYSDKVAPLPSVKVPEELILPAGATNKTTPLPSLKIPEEPPLPAGATTDLVDLIAQPLGFAPRFYPIMRDCIMDCLRAFEKMTSSNPVIDDYRKRVAKLRDIMRTTAEESDRFAPPTNYEEVLRLLTQARERETILDSKRKESEKVMVLREKAVAAKEKALAVKEKELKALEFRLTQLQQQIAQTNSSPASVQTAKSSTSQQSSSSLFADDDDDIFGTPSAGGKSPAVSGSLQVKQSAAKSTSLFDVDDIDDEPTPGHTLGVADNKEYDKEQPGAMPKHNPSLFDLDEDLFAAVTTPSRTAAIPPPAMASLFEDTDGDPFVGVRDHKAQQRGGDESAFLFDIEDQAGQTPKGVPVDEDDDFLQAVRLSRIDAGLPPEEEKNLLTPGTPSPQSPSLSPSLQPSGSHLLARPSTTSSSSMQPSSSGQQTNKTLPTSTLPRG